MDMKLGPVTKLDKRNLATLKNFDNDVMPTNCDATVFFLIHDKSVAIWKPYSGSKV